MKEKKQKESEQDVSDAVIETLGRFLWGIIEGLISIPKHLFNFFRRFFQGFWDLLVFLGRTLKKLVIYLFKTFVKLLKLGFIASLVLCLLLPGIYMVLGPSVKATWLPYKAWFASKGWFFAGWLWIVFLLILGWTKFHEHWDRPLHELVSKLFRRKEQTQEPTQSTSPYRPNKFREIAAVVVVFGLLAGVILLFIWSDPEAVLSGRKAPLPTTTGQAQPSPPSIRPPTPAHQENPIPPDATTASTYPPEIQPVKRLPSIPRRNRHLPASSIHPHHVSPPAVRHQSNQMRLSLHTTPPGAAVYLATRRFPKKTPVTLHLRHGTTVKILLKKKGFLPKTFIWKAVRHETKKFRLAEDVF